MSRLWVTGYRSYEIGTFGDKDPKITVMKYALTQALREQLELGLEWVITGGQLGIEQWTVEVVAELKTSFPDLKIAMMFPFQDFGKQWQANNQEKLQQLTTQCDFVAHVSTVPYQGPQQLQNYQQFMLAHTDAALLVYDPDFEGKTQYDFQAIKQQQAVMPYPLTQIDMYQLQEYATEYEEKRAEEQDLFK
ncbi:MULTISPECIES: DUF1273 domain-containing protein [Leuconostoc]|uniref:UPF0398 protein HF966_00600 n=1 Tax=Leuconostoc holzapfelii TaxID=434464 RepID=A0A846Z8M2_9LACO|nr:DUF1273 domain-containing protein [Leuconostoc holzapfelii]NKZ17696.1 DUF1273 domain-containing protein [Leuconostoc holzapfelii]